MNETNDPISAAIYESIRLWLRNEIPNGPPYGELTPKTSGLLLDLVNRIKKTKTTNRPLEFISMVSSKTQEPMIRIVWGDSEGQVLPSEARELCLKLLDVAHAAEADSFLYALVVDKLGLPKETAYGILGEFREYREKMEKQQFESGRRVEIVVEPEVKEGGN